MPKRTTIEGIPLVEIPGGSYMMGHEYRFNDKQPERVNRYYPDEQPVRRMSVRPFLMGETPVTQAQYRRIMGESPSRFTGDEHPVTNTGAGNMEKYLNALSRKAGLAPCYDEKTRKFDPTKNGFRLPTEVEWEYACRAGTTTHFHAGDTERDLERVGWFDANSGGATHPVKGKDPNAWGLYDMHGNVFEFCEDNWIPAMCLGRYLTGRDTDVNYNYYHDLRVTRGGSWFSEPSVCRSAARSCFCNWVQLIQAYYIGIRVAKNIG